MARTARLQIKQLKELQSAMGAAAAGAIVSPAQVRPVLAKALLFIKDEAYRTLKSLTTSSKDLPPGWEHIEDALVIQEGKSDRVATAFCKVSRKKSPQAVWIEWGHRVIGPRPNRKDTGKTVAPRPFFRPAILSKRTATRRAIRIGLRDLIKTQWTALGATLFGGANDDSSED